VPDAVPVLPIRAVRRASAFIDLLHGCKERSPGVMRGGARFPAVGRRTGDEASSVFVAIDGRSAGSSRVACRLKACLAGCRCVGWCEALHKRAARQTALGLAARGKAGVERRHLRRHAEVGDHALRAAPGVAVALADARLVGVAGRTGGTRGRFGAAVRADARGAHVGPVWEAADAGDQVLGRVVRDADELAAGKDACDCDHRGDEPDPSVRRPMRAGSVPRASAFFGREALRFSRCPSTPPIWPRRS
jgi:hypothetical protein